MKHEAPKPQATSAQPRAASRSSGNVVARTDVAAGHRYAGGAATRGGGQPAQSGQVAAAPQSELHSAAIELRETQGDRLQSGAAHLGVDTASLAALVLAERHLLPRPVPGMAESLPIRFEPHVFFEQTGRWLPATHRDQAAEYRVFDQARAVDEAAAHRALRMGVGQVSGMEAEMAGYPSAEAMRVQLATGPDAQIEALLAVVAAQDDLRGALQAEQWSQVAQLRAGPGYGALGYDLGLQAAQTAWQQVASPGPHGGGKPSIGGGDDDTGDDKPTKRKRK